LTYFRRRIDTFFVDAYFVAVAVGSLIALKSERRNKRERLNQRSNVYLK
jgi:hypothetical protein